ncbi:hypothetical protein TWF281_005066 [Arthrobotrys megalospora]
MKFTAIVTLASAIAAVAAAPTAPAAPAAPANSTAEIDVAELQERANNGANCRYKFFHPFYSEYRVITWGPWAQDNSWGRGLLDNLRGQCGVITDWEFYYRGDRSGVATFKGTIFCTAKKVQDAIWLASGPTNAVVRCEIGL